VYDAIVLAGGAARRLGGQDKPGLLVAGATLLARVVAAVADAGRIAVVGPPRDVPREVVWCRESPPGGGPVAAAAAGLAATSAAVVVVLAADLPFVAPAIPVLVAALSGPVSGGAEAAFLVDPDGRVNYLAGVWRRSALIAALRSVGLPDGASMRALSDAVSWSPVDDAAGWGRDCDTWADLAAARAAADQRTRSSPA
jgi:molybdopterin-guanine dinucleotide biosynthesis protein A